METLHLHGEMVVQQVHSKDYYTMEIRVRLSEEQLEE